MSESIYIGLGSNLGDRIAMLQGAVRALRGIDAVTVVRGSSLYDSAPVGPQQPRYLNAVVELDSELAPRPLLGILRQIEKDLGRAPGRKWAPRTIDLDILLCGETVIDADDLKVPHPELHNRRFALEPLCELCPERLHPSLGVRLIELLSGLGKQDVVRLELGVCP